MATLDGAGKYFAGTLREDAWSAHSDEERSAAIKDASLVLMRLSFHPRPPQGKMNSAIYEQALCLLETTDEMRDTHQNIVLGLTSATVSKQSETYGSSSASPAFVDGVFVCPNALGWISSYLMKKSSAKAGRLPWRGDGRCR